MFRERSFQYITFRSALAFILSLLLSTIYGKESSVFTKSASKRFVNLISRTKWKAGNANHGGLIIHSFATLVPVMLFAKLQNIYVVLLIVTTLWMGTTVCWWLYKIFKKDKGLKGILKYSGVGLVWLLEPFLILVRQQSNRYRKRRCFQSHPENVITERVVEENLRPLRFLFKNNELIAELLALVRGLWEMGLGDFIPVVILLSQRFQTSES
jgi:phospho-N-acetylmuramoyl-pentapeptide-transferase